MARKKQVTEIRDDVFFRKLLDVSKNAVFIGWSGVHRKEYQGLLKANLPHLRELSIIENAGFESTTVSVALYVFSEDVSDTYISRVYDMGAEDKIVYEERFDKRGETVEYAKVPIPKKDLRPKLSDFFKTVTDYMEWEEKQVISKRLAAIKAWERGEAPCPWEAVKDEPIEWEKGGNAMLSDASFRNYVKAIQSDLNVFSLSGDISILYTLRDNLRRLGELGETIHDQIRALEELEGAK